MTLVLELSPEQEAALREKAKTEARPFYETATPEEWVKAFHEWTHSHDPNGAVLLDDSREVIYED